MEINYKTKNNTPITPCPHGVQCNVGSGKCLICDYNEGRDFINKTVTCNHPGGEK